MFYQQVVNYLIKLDNASIFRKFLRAACCHTYYEEPMEIINSLCCMLCNFQLQISETSQKMGFYTKGQEL